MACDLYLHFLSAYLPAFHKYMPLKTTHGFLSQQEALREKVKKQREEMAQRRKEEEEEEVATHSPSHPLAPHPICVSA